ncbi:unnamed protein product [Citrullus colocynthis]|uniref:Uncharacterized protein n=1 Tax=Citrullus colocynthis TaxID=252529 RepID=A0ABP0Y0B8_9ROSI
MRQNAQRCDAIPLQCSDHEGSNKEDNNGEHEGGGGDDQIERNERNGKGRSEMNPIEGNQDGEEELAMVVVNQIVEQNTNEQPAKLQIIVHPREETIEETSMVEPITTQPPPPYTRNPTIEPLTTYLLPSLQPHT